MIMMKIHWCSIVALLAFCGEMVSQLHAGPVSVGINQNLTKTAGNQYETTVAINPANNQMVFMASRNELGGLYTARSTNGGVTWTSKFIAQSAIPPAGNVPRAYGNASAAWDSFGNLYLVYISQNSVNSVGAYATVAVSKDGGSTFYAPYGSGPAMILPYTPPFYKAGDQPTVTVGPGTNGAAGSVWVTYFSQGGIWVSGADVSSNGTVSTFVSQLLPSQPAGVNFGDIAVGPNGEVAVTYGPNTGTSGSLYLQVNTNGVSGTFSPPVLVTSVNVGGFSYLPAQPNWGIDPEAGLAWDRTSGPRRGRLYFVFTDAQTSGSTDTDIYIVTSDDLGSTWSPRVRVNDDTGTNSQILPHISLDQSSGNVAVTWYDCRNSSANNTAQYFGAISTNGGASFEPNFQISSGTSYQARSIAALRKTDYGDYTGNAFASGILIAAWADNSNSTGDNPEGVTNFDVYTAAITVPPNLPPLTILLSGTDAILSWPTFATAGFHLEQTTTLAPSSWSLVPNAVLDNGVTKSVTLPTHSGSEFFRLAYPSTAP